MARKRPTNGPQPEQLVFPFQLRLGDVILEEGVRAEVVGRPTNATNGKTTRAWLCREGETVQHEAVWEAWRKVRVGGGWRERSLPARESTLSRRRCLLHAPEVIPSDLLLPVRRWPRAQDRPTPGPWPITPWGGFDDGPRQGSTGDGSGRWAGR
jgi:hypothetical protein